MGGIRCECGWIIKDTAVPNESRYWVHTDNTCLQIEDGNINVYEELLDSYDFEVWRCTECGRLHVFDRDGKPLKTYKAEE